MACTNMEAKTNQTTPFLAAIVETRVKDVSHAKTAAKAQ